MTQKEIQATIQSHAEYLTDLFIKFKAQSDMIAAQAGIITRLESCIGTFKEEWRRAMQHMLMQDDRALHIMGLVSMVAGVVLLYMVH